MLSLGYLLHERGDFEEAEAWYRRAGEFDDPLALLGLALLLEEQGDRDAAALLYERVAAIGATTPDED